MGLLKWPLICLMVSQNLTNGMADSAHYDHAAPLPFFILLPTFFSPAAKVA